jgi:hypothetical protein
VNRLLCLIYKLNFIISVCRKNIVYVVFGTVHSFRYPLGFFGTYPQYIGSVTLFGLIWELVCLVLLPGDD